MLTDRGSAQVSPVVPSDERLPSAVVEALYQQHGSDILAFLFGVLRDHATAQDVLQITFHRLLEIGNQAHEETTKGWLFKTALREALLFRRKLGQHERLINKLRNASSMECSQCLAEELLVKNEDVQRLKALVMHLPVDQRVVLEERFFADKTFAVIAESLNLPLGTVLTRMRLALEKLRKWMSVD